MEDSVDLIKELITFISKSLVDDPDAVEVDIVEGERVLIVELKVAPDDLGKVIGREGRTARAIRTLLSAATAKTDKRAVLEILE